MLKDILAAFKAPEPPALQTDDARLALAALMIRLARSDDAYANSEQALISDLLAQRYGLDNAAALSLRAEAETLEEQAPDTQRFTHLVKQSVPYENRTELVEDLWAIALADGVRDNAENSFLRLVVSLLAVSDKDSALARQKVEKQG